MLTDRARTRQLLLYHAAGERMTAPSLPAPTRSQTLEEQPLSFAERPAASRSTAAKHARDLRRHPDRQRDRPPHRHGADAAAAETNVVSGTALYSVDLGTGAAT